MSASEALKDIKDPKLRALASALVNSLLGGGVKAAAKVTHADNTMLIEDYEVSAAVLANRSPMVEGYLFGLRGRTLSGEKVGVDLILPRESKQAFIDALTAEHFPDEPCGHVKDGTADDERLVQMRKHVVTMHAHREDRAAQKSYEELRDWHNRDHDFLPEQKHDRVDLGG